MESLAMGIVLLLLGSGSSTHFSLASSDSCPVDPAHCVCMPNEASFMIWCPGTVDHSLKITIKPRILGISCNANRDQDFSALLEELQKLDLSSHGAIDKLYYQHCRIPSSFDFSALTSALNISSVKEMHLAYNTFDEGKGFMEGQFRGTSPDLERIEIKSPNFKGNPRNVLTPGMFDGVNTQIKFLSISTSSANSLPSGLFSSMTSLELLNIGEQGLKELSPDVLNDLKSLKRFYLVSRTLKGLPHNLLEKNKALQHVELGITNLTSTVSPVFFQNLTELKTLEVRGNFLQMTSPQMFTYNSKLVTVIWNNYFPCRGCKRDHRVKVPSFAKGSSSLKELLIKWNRRYDLIMEDDFIEGCSGLEKMSIRKTGLVSLPGNVFQKTRALKSLDLSSNAIEDIQDTLFKGLTDLKELNLNNNHLKKISGRVFSDQRSLESLDLSKNGIETIEDYAFHFMQRLQKLNLRNNALTFEGTEPKWESLSQLKRIDLSYNKIAFTDFNIQFRLILLSLEEINLANNLIGPKLQRDFLKFHQNNLTINLRDNQIKEIQPFPPHGNQNIHVYLNGNPMDCNCKSLDFHQWARKPASERTVNFPDLKQLKCQAPPNLANRIFQDVNENQLSCAFPSIFFPDESCPCRECKYTPFTKTLLLNCSNAGLTSFPKTIPKPIEGSQWIALDMKNNQLDGPLSLPDYAQNITELDVSFNHLNAIPTILPIHLKVLRLDHNEMELDDEGVLALVNSPSLRNLSLSKNNYPCNCHSKSLFRLLKQGDSQGIKIKDAGETFLRDCNIQGAKQDVLISNFADEEDFCLELNTLVVIYALPAILVLLLLLTFVILSLIYKDKIIIILYQYPVFRKYFISNDESKNPYDVFISYSHEDREYVEGSLVDGLESPEDDPLLKYKCLLAIRDFIPGEVISEQIIRAVDSSSRTIIVLSEAFLRSEWAKYEFEIAHSRRKVILLKIGDLPDKDVIGPALMNYISQNTYLDQDHPNFWRNLRYALPHKGSSRQWPSWLKPRKTVEQLNLMESSISKPVPPFNNSLPV